MNAAVVKKAVLLGAMIGMLAGCSDELDPTNPGDAYLMFRDALFEGNSEKVWERLDPQTHEYFDQSYAELEEMSKTIERYLPQSDHRIARSQSGAKLLNEVSDGKTLFLRVLTPKELPTEEAYKLGSDIKELSLSEDESFAKVVTKGGQTFYLAHNKDGQWYVMFLKSSEELRKNMSWVESNKLALSQTVDDLIAEERTEREKIISELMGYKTKQAQ